MSIDINKIKLLIDKVQFSGILLKSLHFIPENGAKKEDIEDIEEKIGSSLSEGYKQFLLNWDGANLDVIRIFGTHNASSRIMKLTKFQFDLLGTGRVVIGSDPAGFLYAETPDGSIYMIDTDGDSDKLVAMDIEDLLCNYVFGERASEFAGDEWVQELKDAKIL